MLEDAMRHDEFVSTQKAADLLNVPHSYLLRLLDQGSIPSQMADGERRVRRGDLLIYKGQRDDHRRCDLADLYRLSDELGLYDQPD